MTEYEIGWVLHKFKDRGLQIEEPQGSVHQFVVGKRRGLAEDTRDHQRADR